MYAIKHRQVDDMHWGKFTNAMKKEYLQPDYEHDFSTSDFVFMRWKVGTC